MIELERIHVVAGGVAGMVLSAGCYIVPRRKMRHVNAIAAFTVSGLAVVVGVVGDADVEPKRLVVAHADAQPHQEAADGAHEQDEPRTRLCVVPPTVSSGRLCTVPETVHTRLCTVPSSLPTTGYCTVPATEG